MDDLPSRLLAKRDQVRDEVLPAYEAIGPAGGFAVSLVIKPALKRAEEALKNHDAAEMIGALRDLEGIKF
jgi:hypothetical protein